MCGCAGVRGRGVIVVQDWVHFPKRTEMRQELLIGTEMLKLTMWNLNSLEKVAMIITKFSYDMFNVSFLTDKLSFIMKSAGA